jgi:rubrerythrin
MKNRKKLLDLMKAQIELEKDISDRLSKLEGRIDSIAARLLIREIQLDTKKHAEILGEALKVVDAPRSFWDYTIHVDADKEKVKKELVEHIKAEEKMRQQIEEEAKKTDDEALELLLKHFAEDEKKHHRVLKTILSKAYDMQV